jgi:small-conductance mechanosensitive channel
MMLQTVSSSISSVLEETVTKLRVAVPEIITGLVFLMVAYLGIKLILNVLRRFLERTYPKDEKLVADLLVTVAGVFLWFGVALVFLDIVGMGGIAASLGTSTGFIALGVSYALSGMIADTVSGVYLLRDPDFNAGDLVKTTGIEGEVRSIELRKTRFEVEGDTVVVSNSEVEKRWRKVNDA